VVVCYFNLFRASGGPDKTNPPLVVDADAVLSGAISGWSGDAMSASTNPGVWGLYRR